MFMHRNYRLKIILSLLVTSVIGIPSLSLAQYSYKYKASKEVYTKIARAVKDSRRQPTFNFIPNEDPNDPDYNAYFNPTNNTINLGEGIYDLTTEFGVDSLNALATVLGHELAHFYKDHGWGMHFGSTNEGLDIAKDIYKHEHTAENHSEMEAEADYFGGLFGYLAGYNTLAITGDFFDLLYEKMGLEDETYGYPSKQERVKIAENSRKMLEELVPVFDAANYLTMIGQYELAATCYEHIIKTFPSSELYNNIGVTLALNAVSLMEPAELQYVYPFAIDLKTNLEIGSENESTRAFGETAEEKKERLLTEAKDFFETATDINKEYAQAYINLALINQLLEEPEIAVAMAIKAEKLAVEAGDELLEANALVAQGIIQAKEGEVSDAKSSFEGATDGNRVLASANLEVLENPAQYGFGFKVKKSKEKESDLEELISDMDVALLELEMDRGKKVNIKAQNEMRPETNVYSISDTGYEGLVIEPMSDDGYPISFLSTPNEYKGATAQGVRLGDNSDKIIEQYGEPAQEISTAQGSIYVYKQNKIIFDLNHNKEVTGWRLYID